MRWLAVALLFVLHWAVHQRCFAGVAQTCGHLERQAADLEATAHPALDALTRVVTTATLERVRLRHCLRCQSQVSTRPLAEL